MKVKELPKVFQQKAGIRAAYTAPRIAVFGAVGALTQGGSAGSSEIMDNGMGMISCSNSMNQQINSMC